MNIKKYQAWIKTSTILISSLSFMMSLDARNFLTLYSFGDSQSDTGNHFTVTQGEDPAVTVNGQPTGNLKGRASNGSLWNENLASNFGKTLPFNNNYAYGTAGVGNTFNVVPFLNSQVNFFKAGSTAKTGFNKNIQNFTLQVATYSSSYMINNSLVNNLNNILTNYINALPIFPEGKQLDIAFQEIRDDIQKAGQDFLKEALAQNNDGLNLVDIDLARQFAGTLNNTPAIIQNSALSDIYNQLNTALSNSVSTTLTNLKNLLQGTIAPLNPLINESNTINDQINQLLGAPLGGYLDDAQTKVFLVQKQQVLNPVEFAVFIANFDALVTQYNNLGDQMEVVLKNATAQFDTANMSNQFIQNIEQNFQNLKDTNPLPVGNDPISQFYAQNRVLNVIPANFKADPNALYTIWSGSPDYDALALTLQTPAYQPIVFGRVLQNQADAQQAIAQFTSTTVQNILSSVKQLSSVGARYFGVGSLLTNFYQNNPTMISIITNHNQLLTNQLRTLALQNPQLTIYPLDFYTLGQEMRSAPQAFGFTNVTTPCLTTVNGNPNICANPNQFLMWDDNGHLTAHANKILGNFVYEVIQGPEAVMPLRQDAFQTMMTQDRLVQNRLDMLRGDDFTQTSASAQFHQAFSSLSPQKESFYFTMADMRKVNQNPMNRLYAMGHEGTSAQDPFSVYVVGDISFGKWKGQQDRTVGSKQTVGTLTVGMDYAFHPNFKAGASFHYLNGNSKMKDNRGKTEMDGYATSLYGRAQFQDFFMDVVGTHGWQHYKLKRNIRLFNRVAKSRPEGKNWSGIFNTGYNLKWNDLKVTPMAGLRYGDYRINDFTEHGAGVFNMFVNRQKAKSLIGNAGGEVGYTFKVSDIKLTPKVRGFYEHNFKKDKGFLVTEMVSMRVPVRTAVPTRNQNYGRLGGGLEAKFNESTSASVDYEAIVGLRRYQNHTVFGKVKFTF
jgi:outer membrane autotransporter protein